MRVHCPGVWGYGRAWNRQSRHMHNLLHCPQPLYFSMHAKEKAIDASAWHTRVGAGRRANRAKRRKFVSILTPHPVKSPVLRWRPVLSRFYPRVQRWNKNTTKQRAVNSLLSLGLIILYLVLPEPSPPDLNVVPLMVILSLISC